MFEGWLSDLLALYLGQLLDVQKDQLRFSLWSAWRTGIVLKDVPLRQDAFDHFGLPFRLRQGRIGRLTAQVPWKTLSSPLLVELEDVELLVEVVEDRENMPVAIAMQRLWKRKKTLIASEELQDLANETGAQQKGVGSFFLSLLRRVAAVLLKRLQFTVRSVHLSVVDDVSTSVGRRFGLTLKSFSAQGGMASSSENGIQELSKSAVLEGLQLYWTKLSRMESGFPLSMNIKGDYMLERPLDIGIDVSVVLEQRKGTLLSMWTNVSLDALDIALQDWQLVDMYELFDALQWKMVRSRYNDVLLAVTPKPRNWRSMWQFAINAVLLDLYGPVNMAPWKPHAQRERDCLRYTAMYQDKLQLEAGTHGVDSGMKGKEDLTMNRVDTNNESVQVELEKLLSIADIVRCRRLARHNICGVGQTKKVSTTTENSKSSAAIQQGRGGIIQGLAKAARIFGFSTSWVSGQSSEMRVAAPTDSEVQELYTSVIAAYSNYEDENENENESGEQKLTELDWQGGQLATEDNSEGDVDESGIRVEFGVRRASLMLLDSVKYIVATINAFGVQLEAKFKGNVEHGFELMVDQIEGLNNKSIPFLRCGSSQRDLPAVRLHYVAVGCPAVLDVLIQPLSAEASLPYMQKLSSWMPPVMERSFEVSCMETINALSETARLAIKLDILKERSRKVKPIDVVAKIISTELCLLDENSKAGDASYLLISAHEIILHSMGMEERAQTINNIESIVQHQQDHHNEGIQSHQGRKAALETIEQELLYDSFYIKASNVAVHSYDIASPDVSLQVISPLDISGRFKLHTLPGDHSSAPIDVCLDFGTVDIGISDGFWRLLTKTGVTQPSNGGIKTVTSNVDDGQRRLRGAKALMLSLQFGSVNIKEIMTSLVPDVCCSDQICATHATLAVTTYVEGKPSIAIDVGELEIFRQRDRKLAERDGDGDEDGDDNAFGKGALLRMIPSFAKRISLAQARYTSYPNNCGGDRVGVYVTDIRVEGGGLEQKCFLSRVEKHQPSEISFIMESSDQPRAKDGSPLKRTILSVSLSNLAIGHSLLLRAANEFDSDSGDGMEVDEISVEVQNCRVAIGFQPEFFGQPGSDGGPPLEGSLFDFLKLHEDIVRLEVGRLTLNASPNVLFCSKALEIRAEHLNVVTATLGLVGCTGLPSLLLPSLSITSHPPCGTNNHSGIVLVQVPSIDFGVHPSHVVMADLALQLCEHELKRALPASPRLSPILPSFPVDIRLECHALGISILGTTLSSKCLKVEGKGFEASFCNRAALFCGSLQFAEAKIYMLKSPDLQNDVFDFGLSEIKNLRLGDGAPYTMSRYLSIADSGSENFEDAASDSVLTAQEGNWLSPTTNVSHKPSISIVPLTVTAEGFCDEGFFTEGLSSTQVPILLLSLDPFNLDCSQSADGKATDVSCTSFGIRLFISPWQEAMDCFQMYTTFYSGRRNQKNGRFVGKSSTSTSPLLESASWNNTIHAYFRNISVEVVDQTAVARLVACLDVSVGEYCPAPSGMSTRVDVARAMLSVGSRSTVRDDVLNVNPFLGVVGLQAKIQNTQRSFSLSLPHVSCWATPMSLELMTTLFQTVSASLEMGLQGMKALKRESQQAGTGIQAGSSTLQKHSIPSGPLENVIAVDLGCVAILLSIEAHQSRSLTLVHNTSECALLEATLQQLAFQATGTSCNHCQSSSIVGGTASFRFLIDAYDASHRVWEPLVEPCTVGAGFSGLPGPSTGKKLSLDIPEGLELTVTRGGVEAVRRLVDAYGFRKGLECLSKETQDSQDGRLDAQDIQDIICNETYSSIEVVLFLDGHVPRHKLTIPPHDHIPLPSLDALGLVRGCGGQIQWNGRYVGRPDVTSPAGGIVWENDKLNYNNMYLIELRGELPRWSCRIPLVSLGEGASLFPCKTEAMAGSNGPNFVVQAEPTPQKSLIITVRGNVCVRNAAPLDLEVGWSDAGGSIQALGLALAGGRSPLWLPPTAHAVAFRVVGSTGRWSASISLTVFPLFPCDLVLKEPSRGNAVHLVVTRSQEQELEHVLTVSCPLTIHSAIPVPSEIRASMPNGGVDARHILHAKVMPKEKIPVNLFPRLFLKEDLRKLCLNLSIKAEGYYPSVVTLEDLPRSPLRTSIVSKVETHQKIDLLVAVDHDDATGGGWVVRISCGLWVFNRLGIPIAIRQSKASPDNARGTEADTVIESAEEVNMGWIQPLPENYYDAATKHAHTALGLGQLTNHSLPALLPASKSIPAHSCHVHPGMLNVTTPLWLQVRTAQTRAPPGRTFWSDAFQVSGHYLEHPKTDKPLISLSSVPIVSSSHSNATHACCGSYPMLITVGPVPGAGAGVMGVTLSPQYVLHNAMDVSILYRQQGNPRSRGDVVPPGARCPVTWDDATLPYPRLCFRVEEPGWLWSGGVSLVNVGDQLVKIRHRDQHRMTMLVRIDVGKEVTIQTHKFAPYRIENCSLETLHFRQKSVREYRDELRPYCSLPYAWDEPGERHLLVVESFGGRCASTFDLDRVGEVVVFGGRRALVGTVRAEGPMRVLTIIDPSLHLVDHRVMPLPANFPQLSGRRRLMSASSDHRSSTGLDHGGSNAWSFALRLASVGVSLIGNAEPHRREVARLSLIDVKAQCEGDPVRVKAALDVGRVQLDTPARDATFPVALVLPAPFSIKASSFKPSTLTTPAITLALSVWTRRPAEVLCVQRAELIIPSIALYLDQRQVEAMSNALSSIFLTSETFNQRHSVVLRDPSSDSDDFAKPQSTLGKEKMYLEALQVSPVNLTLSFSAFSRFLALADVEDARLRLAGLSLVDRLLSVPTLTSVVRQHYIYALLPELFKLLGAASVIGDPVALVHHLGMGLWSFVSAPAVGLVRSARYRILGHFWVACINGTRSLLVNVAYAVSNAATKAARATKKVVIAWGLGGLDDESIHSVHQIGLLPATARGIVGLLAEPIRGVETRGLGGLLGGIRRGALGAVALPLASALEMAASAADGVRRGVMDLEGGRLTWLRPARAVGNGDSSFYLGPFDWTESMGRWLLDDIKTVEGDAGGREDYVFCIRCDADTKYLVLTTHRLLSVLAQGPRWKAEVLWQCALEDVELVRWQPQAKQARSHQALLRVAAHPPRTWRGQKLMMFSFLCVICEKSDAEGMAATMIKSVECRRMAGLRFLR